MPTDFEWHVAQMELLAFDARCRKIRAHAELEHALDVSRLKPREKNYIRLVYHDCFLSGICKRSYELVHRFFGCCGGDRTWTFLTESGLFQRIRRGYSIGGERSCSVFRIGKLSGLTVRPQTDDPPLGEPEDTAVPFRRSYFRVDPDVGAWVTLPRHWVRRMYRIHTAYNAELGHPQNLDADGATPYGRSLFSSLQVFTLPAAINWTLLGASLTPGQLAWWQWYVRKVQEGRCLKLVWRVFGRVYHPLINLPSPLRMLLRVQHRGVDEPVAVVDLHATYWCFVVSWMKDCAEKRELIALLASGGFYLALLEACSVSMDMRTLKQQVQRQCLLGRGWKHWPATEEKRPVWCAMRRRFPELAAHVDALRRRMNESQLSALLMEKEASLFVDDLLPTIFERMPVFTVHDGLVVPYSERMWVQEFCTDVAECYLGFRPFFKVSSQNLARTLQQS